MNDDEGIGDQVVDALGDVADPYLEEFRHLDQQLRRAWQDRRLDDVAALTRDTIAMLPEFIARTDADRRRTLEWIQEIIDSADTPTAERESWRATMQQQMSRPVVQHLYAVEYGALVLSVIDDDGLSSFERLARDEPGLMELRRGLKVARGMGRTVRTVLDYVRDHAGVIQKELYQTLGLDKSAVSYACWLAAGVGRLEREKRGVTYSLKVPE